MKPAPRTRAATDAWTPEGPAGGGSALVAALDAASESGRPRAEDASAGRSAFLPTIRPIALAIGVCVAVVLAVLGTG